MTRTSTLTQDELDRILNGETNLLLKAFVWGVTPQRHKHWEERQRKKIPLSSEDIEYLKSIVVDKEVVASPSEPVIAYTPFHFQVTLRFTAKGEVSSRAIHDFLTDAIETQTLKYPSTSPISTLHELEIQRVQIQPKEDSL